MGVYVGHVCSKVSPLVFAVCFLVNPLNILGINFLGRRLSLSITMGCTALFFLLLNICTSRYLLFRCFYTRGVKAIQRDFLTPGDQWSLERVTSQGRVENRLSVRLKGPPSSMPHLLQLSWDAVQY